MKRFTIFALMIFSCVSSAIWADMDPGWPREINKEGTKLIYYQPQIDSWKNYRDLSGRMAFSMTPAGGKAVLGVASLEAKTVADHEDRTVVVKDIKIADVRFAAPLAEDASKQWEQTFRKMLSFPAMTISLDRLIASVEQGSEAVQPVAVKTDPPQIFVSKTAGILLLVDGDPVLAPVEKLDLQFVVNTNWDVFFAKNTKEYFLLNGNIWMKSTSLNGPWGITKTLPVEMSKLPASENWADVRKNVPPGHTNVQPAQVFYSSAPAELILFKGEPVYSSIPGTRLVYATNTDSDLFVQSDESQYYFLTSGRWFRAKSLEGPWSYAGADLPSDFVKIPEDSPKFYVLAAVPGTQQAKDAVLLAQIPKTATVNRKEAEAKVKVVYQGDPQFKPIEGTSMQYAANTQEKVIVVQPNYYLCYQGVWFVSDSANGPWKVADSVPDAIYTIPPSSPVYNVTYVTVSNPTATTVECSHTDGYLGVFVIGTAVGATMVYGTGYYYPPYYYYPVGYYYPVYWGYPYTYGIHAVYNPWTGGYHVGHYAYGPYGAVGSSAWYNPATGRYGRSATVQGPYGGRTVASAYNPWTGAYGATRQGHNPYAQWGSSVAVRGDDWVRTQHVTTNQGTLARFQTSSGESGSVARKSGGGFVATGGDDNNVYAGKDGNVYKQTSDGWSKYEDGGWNTVDTSGAQQKASEAKQNMNPDTLSNLKKEASARDWGSKLSSRSRTRPTTTSTRRRNR